MASSRQIVTRNGDISQDGAGERLAFAVIFRESLRGAKLRTFRRPRRLT